MFAPDICSNLSLHNSGQTQWNALSPQFNTDFTNTPVNNNLL